MIKDKMENVRMQTIAGRDYHSGKLYGIDVTLVFFRWVKVTFSSTVTLLINIFRGMDQ